MVECATGQLMDACQNGELEKHHNDGFVFIIVVLGGDGDLVSNLKTLS